MGPAVKLDVTSGISVCTAEENVCVLQSYHFFYYVNCEVSLESQAAGH